MISRRLAMVAAGLLATASFAQAQVLIPGGGSKKTDCFAEWQVNSGGPKTTIKCIDGSSCDADGVVDGSCTFTVGMCVNQTNVPGCTPAPLSGAPVVTGASIQAPSDLTTAGCGAATDIVVPLLVKKNKCKKSKPTKLTMTVSAGKPDRDKLKLICLPAPTSVCGSGGSTTTTTIAPCPTNPAGGPSELKLTTIPGGVGGDLDNGFNGGSHNFPLVDSSALYFCLSDCGGADTSCTGTGPVGPGTKNTVTWGAPLPLIAATPVCVVNRFKDNLSISEADYATGAVTANVPLLSDVYITSPNEVCPQCSGNGPVGSTGTCRGGKNNGKPCTVHGLVRVAEAPVNDKDFELSADCPPAGSPVATLDIPLNPFKTGTASISAGAGGTVPCPGQPRHDACTGGGSCSRDCSSGTPVARGGYQQYCCSNQDLPCFPTATLGILARTGSATVPSPQGSFPATSSVVLASVFCEGRTGNSAIDNIAAGLPGPGALLQPMSADWLP